ncbi:hypothetical protein Tco_0413065 [Tanacetum coccineum]
MKITQLEIPTHQMNTTKTAWRPIRKVVGSVKPQWKPTGRHFALYDNCPLTRIMEPIVEPLELTPSVSSSSKVTKISRFPDCKLSDRKAGSKGISGLLRNTYSVLGLRRHLSRKTANIRESDLLGASIHTVILDHHGYQGDDDEDDGASRASTPSPTTYLNSLEPLDYQQYNIPTSSE